MIQIKVTNVDKERKERITKQWETLSEQKQKQFQSFEQEWYELNEQRNYVEASIITKRAQDWLEENGFIRNDWHWIWTLHPIKSLT